MSSKNDAVKEIQIRNTESSDAYKQEIPNFAAGKRRSNSIHDREEGGVVFPKKRLAKRVPQIIFSTLANASTVSVVMHSKNIHSDWITCTTVEELSWGYLLWFHLLCKFSAPTSPYAPSSNHICTCLTQ